MLRGERKLNININYQLVWIIFELLFQHDPEFGCPVLGSQHSQLLEKLVSLITTLSCNMQRITMP